MTEDELDERLRRELRDLVAGAEPSPLLRKRIEERVGRMSHRRLPVRIGTMRLISIAASVVLVIVPLALAFARGDGHGGKKKAKDLAVGQFTNNQDQTPGGGSGSSEGTAGRAALSPPKAYAQPAAPGTSLGLEEVRPLLPPAPVPEGPSPTTTSVARAAAPAPAGRIVFVSRRDASPGERYSSLYAIRADGTGVSRLTNVPNEDARDPAWSPDRTRIAFSTTRPGDGTIHVFVMDADGSDQRDLGPGSFPSFSADGRQIVFEDGTPSDLLVMGADGAGRRPLLATPANEGAPAWSPDGGSVAFLSDADGATGLYVMGVDGTGIRKVTAGVVGAPAWSPDSRQIAFVSQGDGNLHLVNADGTTDVSLTDDHSANASRPAWSPDGRLVAFASIRERSVAIWAVDVENRALRRLTDAPNGDTDPAW